MFFLSGCILEQICDINADSGIYQTRSYSDRSALVRAVRALLSSVTRVLLIADSVVVKQLFSKERVSFFPSEYLFSHNESDPSRITRKSVNISDNLWLCLLTVF